MIVECPGCKSRYDVTGRPAGTRARCRCGTTFALPAPQEFARTLNCPQCGAACDPDKHACAFCSAKLAVVSCPRCFARVFRGSHHCQSCGVAIDLPARAPAEGDEGVRPCPRCQSNKSESRLHANLVGETLLDECGACGGVWVDSAAFERVIKEKDQQAVLASSQVAAPSGDIKQPPPQPLKYLKCPDCTQLMNRQNFGKRSGIVVDTCKAHGIWFDADELGAAVRFVMRGGLDEARKRDLEELERQLKDKRNQVAMASSQMSMGAARMGMGGLGGHGDLRNMRTFIDILFELL